MFQLQLLTRQSTVAVAGPAQGEHRKHPVVGGPCSAVGLGEEASLFVVEEVHHSSVAYLAELREDQGVLVPQESLGDPHLGDHQDSARLA